VPDGLRHFVDREGDEYFCRDERELVAAMHARAFTKAADDRAFMRAMANRAELFTGHVYRTDSYVHFVEDLIATGLLTEKDE
jgi:hypothetical protein